MYDLTLKNSYFQNNTVSKSSQSKCGIAAAGMLECSPYLSCFFDLEGNKFLDNKAELLVPTIFSKSFLNQTNNLFINNSDGLNFTENISSFPLKITLRSQNPNLTYFSSGETFSLAFNLKDSLNQNFFTKANSTGIIMKSSNETDLTLINTISLSTHYGIFNFSGLEIIKTPNTSFYLEIRLSIYDEITSENFFFSETFIYFSRPCQIGELITTDLQCKMCQHTYYSLIDPMQNPKIHKCTKCEPNAYCPGGRYLIPLSGYWRFSSLSSKIIKCSTREACTGPPEIETSKLFSNMSLYSFNKSFIHGSCFEGHEGNLCFKCIDGYGKTSNNGLCSICEDIEIITYVKLIITLLIILVYSLLNLKALMNVSKSDENSEVIGIVSKICINHLQKMSIMTNFNINVITVDIESFLSFLNTVSFLNENNFSNECFLKKFFTDTEKFYIYKIFFSFVIPIIESFLCLLVLIILEIWIHFRKNQSFLNIKKIYLIFLISCYIFYPFVTKCSLSMINCIYLDESHNKYLYASPNVICWEGFHKQVFFIIGFLGILVWGLFFPVILAYLIGRNMKNIQHPEKQEITSNIIIKIPNLHNQPELFIDRNNDIKFKINEKNDKKFPELKGSNKKNNHKTNQIEETNEKKEVFLFFYKDYKTEFYYWESIIFMQKFFLTLLPNISEIVGDTIDVIFVLIMALYTFFLLKIYPFKISKLNNLELFSILITVMSRVLLLLINFFFKDSNAVSVISAMLILINIFFFLAAIYCIYKYTIWKKFFGAYKKKYDFLKKAVRYMRNFISRKNDKSNGDFSLGNKNSLDQSVVNVNVVINETKRQKSKFAKNLETQIVPIK